MYRSNTSTHPPAPRHQPYQPREPLSPRQQPQKSQHSPLPGLALTGPPGTAAGTWQPLPGVSDGFKPCQGVTSGAAVLVATSLGRGAASCRGSARRRVPRGRAGLRWPWPCTNSPCPSARAALAGSLHRPAAWEDASPALLRGNPGGLKLVTKNRCGGAGAAAPGAPAIAPAQTVIAPREGRHWRPLAARAWGERR